MITRAQSVETPQSLAELDRLAHIYWRPLYAYVRGMGRPHEQAKDDVQIFFMSLLSRDSLRGVHAGTTRFRSFLVACLKNSLISTARRDLAQKRGGSQPPIPLEELGPDIELPLTMARTPEEALDRVWALEVFERAFQRLEENARSRGRLEIFTVLKPVLLGAAPEGGYAALSGRLGVPEGTARKMTFDLRVRLGEFLREEVLQTVSGPEEVEGELRYLVGLL